MSRKDGYVVIKYPTISLLVERGGGGRITSTQCTVFVNTFMTTLPLFYFSNTSFVQGGVDFSRRGRHVNDHFAMLVNSLQKFLERQHTNHSLEKK
jgi:hypothetical protein